MSAKKIDKAMDVTGHLSELRNRLMVTALVFVVFFILGFVYRKEIYHFFEKDIHIKLNIMSPLETVWIFFSIAGLVAIIATIPILTLQIWLFIKPGLKKKERRATLSYIPVIFILFLIGLTAGYFAFTYLIFPFLIALNDGLFNEIFTVEKYFRILFHTMIVFAFVFELPIVMMFLTSLGIITPDFLKRTRKYAYFILLLISGLITPPDLILQIVVAIPLILLYEISIQLASYAYRKRIKRQQLNLQSDYTE